MNCGFIGFGDLGKQILSLISMHNKPNKVALFDDILYGKRCESAFPFESFLDPQFTEIDFYVTLGYRHLKRKREILESLRDAGRRTPAFIHPTSFVHSSSRVGAGSFIYPMCNVDQEVELGAGVVLNNSVTISHNSTIESAAFLAPGVILCGRVSIGTCTFVGAGSSVANGRRIGQNVRIGIGTAVTRDIGDGLDAIGNPMRILDHALEIV